MWDLSSPSTWPWKSIILYAGLFVLSKLVQSKLMPNLAGQPDAQGRVRPRVKLVDRTDVGDNVEPVDVKFELSTAEPHKYRPFRSRRGLHLGITRTSKQDWLLLENTYEQEMATHAKILKEHPDRTCFVAPKSPETIKAVEELYDEVVDALLRRYPRYFVATGDIIANLILNTQLPRKAKPSKLGAQQLLKLLAENVAEDFLLLQPQKLKGTDDEVLVLQAATGLHANGFDWLDKLGQRLDAIHAPVPGYAEQLQVPVERTLKRLQWSQYIQRTNWGVQISGADDLYMPADSLPATAETDFTNGAFVRTERQVLTRLKNSNYIMFSIRTYLYPLSDIKAEGYGPALAQEAQMWTPPMAEYKGYARWGEAVSEYLEPASAEPTTST